MRQRAGLPASGVVACFAATLVVACGGTTTVTVVQATTETETVTETQAAPDASGGGATQDSAPATGATERRIGGTGTDEGLAFTVTSIKVVPFVPQNEYSDPPKITPVAGAKLVTATVTVRNDGQTGVDPFCGGTGAILLDEKDRNFEPLSQAQVSIPGNTICSDEIQPGFKATNILLFQMPKTATPTSLAVWNSASTEDYDHSSYVLFTR